jgi:uncharacterized protein DUF87
VKLRISDDLSLPLEAVTSTFCVVGIRGSGKSTTAVDMAEEMLKAKQQIVVLDPKDDWHGLRSSADGKGEGFPITILGGSRQDAPLESSGGKLVADLVVEDGLSCILSTRHFSDGQRSQFVYDFALRLYQTAKGVPIHLFIDEADQFAPQQPMRDEARMLGLVMRLIKQGRTAGIGVTLITQRPATLSKSAMTQCETLIAMRTIGLQDRKAVEEWVKAWSKTKEQHDETMMMLPTFKAGQGLVWSPAWLELYEVVQFRPAETFDSRKTPKVGEHRIEPKILAPVDLKLLSEKMAATIERVKADDPRELRKQIAELKKQLSTKVPAPVDKSVIERAVANAVAAAKRPLRQFLKNIRSDLDSIDNSITSLGALVGDQVDLLTEPDPVGPNLGENWGRIVSKAGVAQKVAQRTRNAQVARSTRVASSNGHISATTLDKAGRKVLTVLAQQPDGCAIGKRALLSGYRISGGFRNTLSALRTAGFIAGENTGIMRVTDDGIAALGDFDALPLGSQLADYWLTHPSFGACEKQTLQAFLNHPKGLDIEQVAAEAGYQVSGGFRNALSSLRTAGVIVGKNTEVMRANEDLFD